MFVPRKILEEKLYHLLREDIGQGDVTSAAVIPSGLTVEATVVAKEEGIVAGIEETVILAESLGLSVKNILEDGEKIRDGTTIMKIFGDAPPVLSIERTLLNLLSRMSGIATATQKLTHKLRKANLKAKIAATRKTAPGLLYFDKKAVFIGGGDPHRLSLGDMLLVKDNHIAITGSVREAVRKARKRSSFSKKIEVETTCISDVLDAAEEGADIIMFDNFSPSQIRKAVKALRKRGFLGNILLEASGGITAQNILEYASEGVDLISVGELTHSVKSLDISLEIVKVN